MPFLAPDLVGLACLLQAASPSWPSVDSGGTASSRLLVCGCLARAAVVVDGGHARCASRPASTPLDPSGKSVLLGSYSLRSARCMSKLFRHRLVAMSPWPPGSKRREDRQRRSPLPAVREHSAALQTDLEQGRECLVAQGFRQTGTESLACSKREGEGWGGGG